jgi:hypothetical protein
MRNWDTRIPNFEKAAVEVLRTCGAPMTVPEITAEAIGRGLISPEGKTPHKSMYVVIQRSLQRSKDDKSDSPFARVVSNSEVRYKLRRPK